MKGPEDALRQKKLEAMGVRFLRFEESTVRTHLDFVVVEIEKWLRDHHTPRPAGTPLKRGFEIAPPDIPS